MAICQKKQKWLSEFQALPEDVQEWEMAYYLQQQQAKRDYLDHLEKALDTTDPKTNEARIKDIGAKIAILLDRFES